MNCKECREELSAYLDRELDSSLMTQVEAHLKNCSECRTELESMKKIETTLGRYAGAKAPQGFADRTVRATRPTPAAPVVPLWRKPVFWQASAAAVVLIAGSLFFLNSSNTPELTKPEEKIAEQPAPVKQETPAVPVQEVKEEIKTEEKVAVETPKEPVREAQPERVAISETQKEEVDDDLLQNMELLEDLDWVDDNDLALALNLSDEDFSDLLNASEEGG